MKVKKFLGGVSMVAAGVIAAYVFIHAYEDAEHAVRRWWAHRRRKND